MASRTDRFDLRALLETSRLLSSSLEVDFVLNSLLLTAMSKLLVSKGLVLLPDPLGAGYRVQAAKGRFPDGLAIGKLVAIKSTDGVLEQTHVPAPLSDAGVAMLVPITYHDRTIGLIALGRKVTGDDLSPDERQFLEALINMSATAVHNASMVEELRIANEELGHKVQQLNTLFDVAQGFTAAPDVARATRTLSLTLMGQFMVRRFAVYLRTGSDGQLALAASRDATPVATDVLTELSGLKRLMLLDEDAPPELQPLIEAGFALALPLRMQDVSRGVLLLGPKLSREPYSADDVEFLTALGQLALTAIENARGIEARLDKERLEEELRLARDIQERLLPQKLPRIEGAGVAALNLASRYVAGDYYDAIALDGDRLLLAVADVSGKGLPASLLMANLQACIHIVAASLGAETVDLPTATARVNRVIHRNTSITTFITFFWGIYDRRDGSFAYVNAGHNPPLVLRENGDVERLEEGGVLLGVLADAPYAAGSCTLTGADAVLLYTDGITEAWSATDPDDEFGEERLIDVATGADRGDADKLMAAIRTAIREHTGDKPLDDDLTLLVLCREAC